MVSPSSIVNLNFKVRYVPPRLQPTKPVQKSLPNGDSHAIENGPPTPESLGKADDGEGKAAGSGDIKEKVEDAKEKVAEIKEKVAEKLEIGQKGKDVKETKEEWEKNGYAHAPFWPQVCAIPSY